MSVYRLGGPTRNGHSTVGPSGRPSGIDDAKQLRMTLGLLFDAGELTRVKLGIPAPKADHAAKVPACW
jgi:hypothetical protein